MLLGMAKHTDILADLITATEAAELLGLTPERVMQFCRAGRLPAAKPGRDWITTRAAVAEFARVAREPGKKIGK